MAKIKAILAAEARRRAKKRLTESLAKKTDNEIAQQIRTASDGFLRTPEWKALREEAIARYGAICMVCGREQTQRRRMNVDHIKPRKFFPELALCIENAGILCPPCNKKKGNSDWGDYRQKRHTIATDLEHVEQNSGRLTPPH